VLVWTNELTGLGMVIELVEGAEVRDGIPPRVVLI
jgi:hypothetical protein